VLAISGITETITIADEAPVIESARSQITATVSEAEVAALPMNGRNFLDLAVLVPGVAPANIASTSSFPKRPRFLASRYRSAASAISRTTLSSMDCPPTTMPPD
jgi:hypothetical protein